MNVLYPRCCGLDVHKDSVSACVLLVTAGALPGGMGSEPQEVLFFGGVLLPASGTERREEGGLSTAHKILVIAYHILRDGSEYRELGGNR